MMRDPPPATTLELTDVVETCSGAPVRWSARTLEGCPVDIRYRGGCLTVRVGPLDGSIDEAKLAEPCIDLMITPQCDSWASWEEVAGWANLRVIEYPQPA